MPFSGLQFGGGVQELLPAGAQDRFADTDGIDDSAEVDDPESWANEENEGPGPGEAGGANTVVGIVLGVWDVVWGGTGAGGTTARVVFW